MNGEDLVVLLLVIFQHSKQLHRTSLTSPQEYETDAIVNYERKEMNELYYETMIIHLMVKSKYWSMSFPMRKPHSVKSLKKNVVNYSSLFLLCRASKLELSETRSDKLTTPATNTHGKRIENLVEWKVGSLLALSLSPYH